MVAQIILSEQSVPLLCVMSYDEALIKRRVHRTRIIKAMNIIPTLGNKRVEFMTVVIVIQIFTSSMEYVFNYPMLI